MTQNNNAVAYIRVSTEMQVDGYSLDGQLADIKDYCKRNDINLVDIYEDAGISGTSTENRTSFNIMISEIKNNAKGINTVIVWKLSRLSRNVRDLANIVDVLEKNNVNLICITQNIDTSTPMGKSFVYMSAIFAEMERDNIVEQAKMGMKQRALDGYRNGGTVFGYIPINGEIIINEEQSKTVREIFDLYLSGWGYKKIAIHLNDRGLVTLKGSSWSIQGIRQVLDNPVYVGLIKYGEYLDWEKKRRKGKSEDFILVDGKHEPIISEEVWRKTQEMRKVKSKLNDRDRTYSGDFLLTGLLKCPQCGASMISCQKKGKNVTHKYYQCSVYFNKGSKICKSNLIRKKDAEEYVFNRIKEIVQDPKIVEAIIKKMEIETTVNTTPLEQNLKNLNKELEKISRKKNENLELEFEGKIDIDTLQERLSFIKIKEEDITRKVNELEEKINSINNQVKISPKAIKSILENFIEIFQKADTLDRKALYVSIIEKITVTKGDSTDSRKIDKIKLYFEPQEITVALKKQKSFTITYDTVPLSLF